MSADSRRLAPWLFECPKGSGFVHTWKREPDLTATCANCNATLTVFEAAECFGDVPPVR